MKKAAGWVLGVALVAAPGCKGGDDGGRGGARGERSRYYLTSTTLTPVRARHWPGAALALTVGNDPRPCNVAGTAGLCVTPTAARGMVANVSLAQQAAGADAGPGGGPSTSPPARLFGSGEGLDSTGKILLAPFDLAAPRPIPGEGALQDRPARTVYGSVDTLFGYMDVQLPMEGQFWTLRFAFYPQPLADDPAVAMCASESRRAAIAANGTVVPGAPAFARGDVLFCSKPTAAEPCGPTDFQWLDRASGQLTSTRPSQPRQLNFIVSEGIQCQLYPEGPTQANRNQPGELRYNGFRMTSRLTTPISVWARFDQCNKIFSLANATGAVSEGTSLAATLNYDLSGFVFFPGVSDVSNARLTDLLASATLTPLHAREKLGPGPASGEFATATVTLALGNEPTVPCGQPDNWDGGAAPPAAGDTGQ